MFVNGLGTANPPQRYSKAQCWEAFRASDWFRRLDRRAHAIAETVLLHDNGIEARRLRSTRSTRVFQIDPDTLHARFLTHAPALAAEAGARALDDAGLAPTDIDAVVVSTCTGYLCPGLSSYVVERLGLPRDIQAFDLVGQGCAAALPNLAPGEGAARGARRAARALDLRRGQQRRDVSRQRSGRPDQRLPVRRRRGRRRVVGARPRRAAARVELTTACSLVNPDERDALRFESRQGMLRNVLTRPVPRLAADHARQVLDMALDEAGLVQADITAWIMHAGGRDVLKALQGRLDLDVGRASLQRRDAARVRQHEQRLRVLRAAGGAGRPCAAGMVVDVVVRCRIQLPRRIAARRLTDKPPMSSAMTPAAPRRSRKCSTTCRNRIRGPSARVEDLRRINRFMAAQSTLCRGDRRGDARNGRLAASSSSARATARCCCASRAGGPRSGRASKPSWWTGRTSSARTREKASRRWGGSLRVVTRDVFDWLDETPPVPDDLRVRESVPAPFRGRRAGAIALRHRGSAAPRSLPANRGARPWRCSAATSSDCSAAMRSRATTPCRACTPDFATAELTAAWPQTRRLADRRISGGSLHPLLCRDAKRRR